jgi:hypothetical protein
MLESLITSDTRIKLLLKFFLNPKTTGYLRQLAAEFGESTNGIRLELNKLSEAQILSAHTEGRNKIFRANVDHPLFNDIRNIVLKSTGIDKVVSDILKRLGSLKLAFIRGDYAIGRDSGLIDLVIVGDDINFDELDRVKVKTEKLIARKISILILTKHEYGKLKQSLCTHPVLYLYIHKSLQQEIEGKLDHDSHHRL